MSHRNYEFENKTLWALQSPSLWYTSAVYGIFVITSSLIGDTTILIASTRYSRTIDLHKIIRVIIQHIAICDLSVVIVGIIPSVVSLLSNGWAFGNFLCFFTLYTKYYFNLTSALLICTMTTSKLLLLKYPLRFGTLQTNRAHVFCAVSWLVGLALPVMFWLVDQDDVYFSYRSYHCDYGFSAGIWQYLGPLYGILFGFVPTSIVVITTVYILIIARQAAVRGKEKLKWQGIMTIVLTASVYCISILPYGLYQVGKSLVRVEEKSGSFFHNLYYRIALSFVCLNTISNFYIYNLTLKSFRTFVRSRIQLVSKLFADTVTSLIFEGKSFIIQEAVVSVYFLPALMCK